MGLLGNKRGVSHQLIFEEMLVRIAFAVFAGGAIGYEREYKNRPAGFRTHILVCVGACVISLVQVTMNEEIIQRVLLNPNLENVLRADYG
ncbi:MAG: MgtC/SapB family protein, partial [Clostridium sp.]|nr:MgtC/SapB family protein [Clostridium sp.]